MKVFSVIKLFCSLILKFEWEINFLCELPRLFHRRHALSLFKKQKTCTVFLSRYINTSGRLGEQEMLWKHEPYTSIETQRACFLFILENSPTKKEGNDLFS